MRLRNKMGFKELHGIISDTRKEADLSVDIRLVGESADVQELVHLFGAGADLAFKAAGENTTDWVSPGIDLVILTLGGGTPIQPWLKAAAADCRTKGLEVISLIDQVELSEAAVLARKVEAELAFDLSPGRVVFFASDLTDNERTTLVKNILDRVHDKQIPLAAQVPLFRSAVVDGVIEKVANENGIIGLTSIIPGTDLPLLTANQMRMVLKIAAAFDTQLSLKRARELIFVLGGGFTFRAVARQVAALVPVAGWAVKGAVAYTGTRTVGLLAKRYFETLNE